MPTLSLTSDLPPTEFTARLAQLLADGLAGFSVNPKRPTESRIVVRTAPPHLWLYILSTRHALSHLALCGEVSRAPDGGSTIRFQRRLAATQSWMTRTLVAAFFAVPAYQLIRAWDRGPLAVGIALAFAAIFGIVLLGVFSIGRAQAEAEIAALEVRVGELLDREQARRATA